EREPAPDLRPWHVLDNDAAVATMNPSHPVPELRLDAAEVEVSPAPFAAVVDGPDLALTPPAARHRPAWRHVDDEPVIVELTAEDADVLDGKQNSEYTRGAHGGSGAPWWRENPENSSLPVRTSSCLSNSLRRRPTPTSAPLPCDHVPTKWSGEPENGLAR